MASVTKDTHTTVSTSRPPNLEPDPRDPNKMVPEEQQPAYRGPVEPVINEQMTRSREIEAVGVEAWKMSQDQRPIEEQPVLVKNVIPAGDVLDTPQGVSRQVPGISHPTAPIPERAPVRHADGSVPPRA